MGMWQGLLQGMQLADQRRASEEELELQKRRMLMAEEQFLEEKRNKRLDILLSYSKASKASSESAKTKATTIKRLRAIGVPKDVSEFLSLSGEGAEILKVYDKKAGTDELSPYYIPSIIKRVRKVLGDKSSPQALAIATKAALLSTEDLSTREGQEAGLVEAIFAAETIEDFSNVDEILVDLQKMSSSVTADVDIPPIGGLIMGSVGVDETKLKNIENLVTERIAPTYGQIFIKNDDGGYTIDQTKIRAGNAQAVKDIINEATANIVSDIQGVGAIDLNTSIEANTDYAIKMAPQILGLKDDEEDKNKLPDTPSGGLGTGVDIFGSVKEERGDT